MGKPKERPPGRGSVYQRKSDGRWVGVLQVGRGTRSGRERKSLYASSRADVEKLLDAALKAVDQGLAVPDPGLTVGEQLRAWLEWQRPPRVRPSSWVTYAVHVRTHTRPLHGITLLRLTPNDVRRWMVRLRSAREPLSEASIGHSLTVLRMALRQAVGDGLVARNVAEFVESPKPSHAERPILSIDQIRTFFASVAGDRLEALYVVAFATGLRQSELLGLRWSDLDLDAGTAVVRGSLRPVPLELRPAGDKRLKLVEPKTDNAYRAVPLPTFAVEQLRRWQEIQTAEPASLEGLVFTSTRGTPLDGRNTTRLFKRALAIAGAPEIRFHDIRHSTASLLRAIGLSIDDVQSILGHGSAAMTWHYTHVVPAVWDRATAALDRALG